VRLGLVVYSPDLQVSLDAEGEESSSLREVFDDLDSFSVDSEAAVDLVEVQDMDQYDTTFG